LNPIVLQREKERKIVIKEKGEKIMLKKREKITIKRKEE